jgi:hypothetical protein
LSATRTAVKASVSTRLPNIPGAISGPTNICPFIGAGTANYSIPSVTYATSYDWTIPAGASIISGTGTNSITLAFSGLNPAGDIVSVKARSGCGVNETASSLALNIDACPPLPKSGQVPFVVQQKTAVKKLLNVPVQEAIIYPNPSKGDFTVQVKTKTQAEYGLVQLLGLNGKILISQKVMLQKDAGLFTRISAKGLSSGIYIVRYIIGNEMGTLKAIIIE